PTWSPVFLIEMTSSAAPSPCQYLSPSATVLTVIRNRCAGAGGGGGAAVVGTRVGTPVVGASVGGSVVGAWVGASEVGTSTGGALVSSPSGPAYAGMANIMEHRVARSTKQQA